MRLMKAEFTGFGRLADTSVNLDNKVIAFVGPNEAGKTTLLDALAYIDNGESLTSNMRTRGLDIQDATTVVRVQFKLDEGDAAAIAAIPLESPPASLWIARTAGGGERNIVVEPKPRKPMTQLKIDLASVLAFYKDSKGVLPDPKYIAPELEETWNELFGKLELLKMVLDPKEVASEPSRTAYAASVQLKEVLAVFDQVCDTLDDTEFRADLRSNSLMSLHETLHSIDGWLATEEPEAQVNNVLWKRTPDFLLFTQDDRDLKSSYVVNQDLINSTPAALRNLCAAASLDLTDLFASILRSDHAGAQTLIYRANNRLEEVFYSSWKQSKVTVHFTIDGNGVITIAMRQNGDTITSFSERSAGLRVFVALTAFLNWSRTTRPPVLLVDEAETHLHVDAQQDLVRMFAQQDQAAKVIYTTHSPACLPADLGTNIRAVVPDANNPNFSRLKNSIWANSTGFSPLMLAMGAASAAFSSARLVVLAEGASEMLMLPTLIRAATGAETLDYQVAPGLSHVSKDLYSDLDLEGARVAFVVDGDEGGCDLRNHLVKAGVGEGLIVQLDCLTLENTLEPEAYVENYVKLLRECNPGQVIPEAPTLPAHDDSPWPTLLIRWAEINQLRSPGKVAVASRLVENRKAIPSEFGTQALKKLHTELRRCFGLT